MMSCKGKIPSLLPYPAVSSFDFLWTNVLVSFTQNVPFR